MDTNANVILDGKDQTVIKTLMIVNANHVEIMQFVKI